MTRPTAFFNRTYDEAMTLLVEARNYMAYHEAVEQQGASPSVRLQISYESLRVTSRLTQIMAWLLCQKAVHAGEMTLEQAMSDEFALAGGDICSCPSGPENEALPPGLRSLLQRSHALYMRIARLDEMVRRNAA